MTKYTILNIQDNFKFDKYALDNKSFTIQINVEEFYMTISGCYLKTDMNGKIYLNPPKRTYKVGEEWKSYNYFYTNKEILGAMTNAAIKALGLNTNNKQETNETNKGNDFDDLNFVFE